MVRRCMFTAVIGFAIGTNGFVNPVSVVKKTSVPPKQGNTQPLTSVINSGVEDLYSTLPTGARQSQTPPESVYTSAKHLVTNTQPKEELENETGKAVLSGLGVMFAMIPHTLAFSYVAGATPLAGLWTTVILGFVAAAMGARPGVCSSTSGACAVVVGTLGATYGPSYLSACAILSGLLQILGGFVGLGRLIRLIPHPVLLGFVNGLAIVMAKVQLVHFKDGEKLLSLFSKRGASVYGIVAMTIGLVKVLPKYTKIPPSLGAVVVSTLFAKMFNLPLQTLADVAGSSAVAEGLASVPSESFFSTLAGVGSSFIYGIPALAVTMVKLLPIGIQALPVSLGAVALSAMVPKGAKIPLSPSPSGIGTFAGGLKVLPKFGFPKLPWTWATLRILLPYAMTMAAVGSLESLLTMQLVDGMVDDGERGSTEKECVAQGTGNVASGLFGGIGGCAVVGQSILNIENGGGASRLSAMSMALFLALGIVAAGPLLGSIPVASLVGIMLLVCQNTFSWSSLRLLNKIPRMDAFVIALVSIITVRRDLAQAVLAGTVASALSFAWKQSTTLSSYSLVRDDTKLYKISGPLFFGSTNQFLGMFQQKADDPTTVVLDFADSRVMDHSALDAIFNLSSQYVAAGKDVYLRHLSPDAVQLLSNFESKNGAGLPFEIMVDPENDPIYGIAQK